MSGLGLLFTTTINASLSAVLRAHSLVLKADPVWTPALQLFIHHLLLTSGQQFAAHCDPSSQALLYPVANSTISPGLTNEMDLPFGRYRVTKPS